MRKRIKPELAYNSKHGRITTTFLELRYASKIARDIKQQNNERCIKQ